VNLQELGWSPFFAAAFERLAEPGCRPARVAVQIISGKYLLYCDEGEVQGEVAGRLQYLASGPQDLPAVGDWVVTRTVPSERRAVIVDLLPRRSKFSRRAAGKRAEEQVVAANVDVVFLVQALDSTLNLRRLERYLVVASDSGARPVVLLNKSDLCQNLADVRTEVERVAAGAPVHILAARRGEGVEAINGYLPEGVTGAVLGSSGVGKSTIINRLLGSDRLPTQEVREFDDRGRHTTTRRELVILPGRGLLIDTPGIRELQLLGGTEGLEAAFEDVEGLVLECRFRDCRHEEEPGCAVRQALVDGRLPLERFASYQKLLREIAFLERSGNRTEQMLYRDRVKKLTARHKRGYKK
jgi:ribosome biogenesis GTPase / thiamine phosphate phosphatase